MTVLLLDRASPSLRGDLSRWMLEPKAGVFVGRPSAAVRDRLWKRVCQEAAPEVGCVLIYHAASEQGYRFECFGNSKRSIVDFEGLFLVKSQS